MGSLRNTVVCRNELSEKGNSVDTYNIRIQSSIIYIRYVDIILLADK